MGGYGYIHIIEAVHKLLQNTYSTYKSATYKSAQLLPLYKGSNKKKFELWSRMENTMYEGFKVIR